MKLFLYQFVYFGETPLQSAVEKLNQSKIVFRGDMAQETQGKHKSVYKKRLYKGRPADLSKHIRIGNSYSPERCFSVHFELDNSEKALVIHHAGKHLPTSRD